MCGIAGYFGTRELEPERVAGCLSLMGRRGPDAAGQRHWRGPSGRHAHLLHSRLNIIDLDSRADQPFEIAGRWIAFNGEIYNYKELKKELTAAGSSFRTQSDTEVLLEASRRWDWDCLDRCEGMWAFAAYDEGSGGLTLSRDRFGEKPLYLYRDPTGLYFGSEIKFIRALLGARLELDYDHLKRYLVNGYKSLYKQPRSFFRGVCELAPGSILRLDAGGGESSGTYWQPAFRPDEAMSYEDAVSGVRRRLIRSVELRLRADVPLAFCMSGGVDSNALISIAKNVFGYDVHGFTIANSDARYEESEMVEHAVAELKLRHTSVPVDTRDFLPRLRALVRQHDAPIYTISYYAHWLLMEAIGKQGYRISVSGTAADELFTGYYDHHLAYLYEVQSQPELLAASRAAWERHVKPIVRNPFLGDAEAFIRNPGLRDHIFLNSEGFSSYLAEPWSEPFGERQFTSSLLRNRMLNELFHEAVPVILHEDDLNAMYFSIENRSPYLDRDLFEFSYSIPSRHLIQDGYTKSVLRDALKGIAPERVRTNRRKVGFNAPIFSFLDVRDPGVRQALLADSPIFELVRREKISELLDKAALPNSESKFLFYFLASKMFVEEFGA